MTPFFIPDPVLGWRRTPGTIKRAKEHLNWEFTIAENGYRSIGPNPAKAKKRVWLFGDSFTEGFWLDDEDTYCRKLQKRFPDWAIELFAVGGYSTFQNLLQLEALLVTDVPDYVLFSFIPSHLGRNVADPYLWKYDQAVGQDKIVIPGFVGAGFAQFRPAAYLEGETELSYQRVYRPQNDDELRGMLTYRPQPYYQEEVATRIVARARDLTVAAGGCFYFTVLRSAESLRHNGPASASHLQNDTFIRRLQKVGVDIIDADPRVPFEESTFLPVGAHPNPAANDHFANMIALELEAVNDRG